MPLQRSAVPSPATGIGLKVVSALAFTLMSAGIKWLGRAYPIGEVVFFRSAFALVPLLAWLAWQGDVRARVRTSNIGGHILRGLIGSAGMFCGFASLSYLPLSDAVVIGYAAPLLTVVFAALFLRERVRIYRWGAVLIGFVGVAVMVLPHLDLSHEAAAGASAATIGSAFGLTGAICAAGATIQVRRLTGTERTGAIVLYFSLLTTALGLTTVALGWKAPTGAHWAVLFGIGLLGGIGQILLTEGYRYADASLIAPFDYTTMIWSVLLGWLLFSHLPDPLVFVGGVIVISAGIFVIWREHRLGLIRAKHVEVTAQRGG